MKNLNEKYVFRSDFSGYCTTVSLYIFKINFMKGEVSMNALTSMLSKTWTRGKFKAVKYGPALAIGAGIIGMAGSLYLTYRATTKIEEAKKEKENGLAMVAAGLETGFITKADGTDEIYSHEDGERDTKIYKSRYIVALVKYLAPPVATFIISGLLIGLGTKALWSRLAVAGTTIAGLIAKNNELTKDLEDAVGKEKANDILLGKHTTTETELKEDGSIETIEKTITNRFIYGNTFEFSKESSPELYSGIYQRDMDYIRGVFNRANWLMDEKKGHVTFANVLDEMDVQITGCGYTLDVGSISRPGYTIIPDIDERFSEDGKKYFIITVNWQGYIKDKI